MMRIAYLDQNQSIIFKIYVNKAILGATGLNQIGVSNVDLEIGETYKAMARSASETIIVADSSKISKML